MRKNSILGSPVPRRSSSLASYLSKTRKSAETEYLGDFPKILDILHKPPEQRTTEEVQYMVHMTESMSFFQKLSKKMGQNYSNSHYKCLKLMRYKMVPKGQAVVYHGEIPDAFYIILKGSAFVLLPKDEITIKQEKELSLQNLKTNSKFKIQEESPLLQNKALKSLQKITKMMRFLKASHKKQDVLKPKLFITQSMVAELGKLHLTFDNLSKPDHYFDGQIFKYYPSTKLITGQAFGELGLLRRKPRAATILCVENTHLGFLKKEDYEIVYFDLQSQKLRIMLKFFNKSLGRPIANDTLTKYAYLFEKRKYKFGDKLFKENNKIEEVFLIKKGEIETRIKRELANDNQEKLNELLFKTKKKNKWRLGLFNAGEYLGEDDLLLGRNRSYEALCVSSKATLYVISKQNFLKFLQEYKDINKIFMNRIKLKQSWNLEQISEMTKTTKQISKFKLPLTQKKDNIKCSAFDLKEIICKKNQIRNTSVDLVNVWELKSKKEGLFFRGLRDDNPKKIFQQYPLLKNVKKIVSSNSKTLNNLLQKNGNVQEEGIFFKHCKTNSINFASERNKQKHFSFTKYSMFDYFAKSVKDKIKKSNEEDHLDLGITIEGGIEKQINFNKTYRNQTIFSQ